MQLPHIVMLIAAAVAAYTDTRTGMIPNWLTLPIVVLGPLYFLIAASPDLALASAGAVLIVGFVPFLMYRSGSMGGGDVKIFAALGGLGGLMLGLELMLYSFFAAMVLSLFVMARHGHLKVVLANVGRILANPLLPQDRKMSLERREMHQMRLGFSIFLGTALALGSDYALV